jgi:hypothetical protein
MASKPQNKKNSAHDGQLCKKILTFAMSQQCGWHIEEATML